MTDAWNEEKVTDRLRQWPVVQMTQTNQDLTLVITGPSEQDDWMWAIECDEWCLTGNYAEKSSGLAERKGLKIAHQLGIRCKTFRRQFVEIAP